jgi:WD40 repeat protein
MTITNDNTKLILGTGDNNLVVFDLNTTQKLYNISVGNFDGSIYNMVISADDKILYLTADKYFMIYNLQNGQLIEKLNLKFLSVALAVS